MTKFFRLILGATIILSGAFVQAHDHGDHKQKSAKVPADTGKYGGAVPAEGAKPLSQVIATAGKSKEQTVVVEGVVKQVCQQKGCWMVLEDKGVQVRTLFKDYGFFVPKDLPGKRVRAVGTLEQKHLSVAARRHYAKDGGAKLEEIQKIRTGELVYQFTAEGVEVL